jgi:ABC-type polar amino acid transport system ATPase subunit
MNFARDMTDRVLCMDSGIFIEEGPVAQLIDHPSATGTASGFF